MIVAKSMAGGLPLSGVIGRAEIMDDPHPGAIGGTFIGNPVALAAACAVLDVFEEEQLVERAQLLGEAIRTRMLDWQSRWPQIGDVRGMGAMLAIELVRDPDTRQPARNSSKRSSPRRCSEGCCCSRPGSTGTASACSARSRRRTPSSTTVCMPGKRGWRRSRLTPRVRISRRAALAVHDARVRAR